MPIKHEPLRYAHDRGHTDVSFSSDGSKFVTCGADGDIRIWPMDESEDPIHNCVGEWALSVRQCGDSLYVATGTNDIQILTFPEGERNGVLHRFTAPINQIAVAGNFIALAGEDMKVRLFNLEKSDEQRDITVFEELKGPCLSVSLSPTFKYVASSCGDSNLRVWDIASKQLIKELSCFPKVNSFANAKTLCRVDFDASGQYLAYPDKSTIVLLNTSDWSLYATLSSSEVLVDYSIVQFSPCGKYVGATTLQGDFVFWNVQTEQVEGTTKHEKCLAITGFDWDPSGSSRIVFTDVEGQLGLLSECVPTYAKSGPSSMPSLEAVTNSAEYDVDFGDVQFDSKENSDADDGDDEIEKINKQIMTDDEDDVVDSHKRAMTPPRPKTPERPMQPPIMPSSTPEQLNPRYLCWNELAIVRSYGAVDDDDSAKSIEVEFHDSSFHNSIMIQNYPDYFMASVSKSALVVANTSQISIIPLAVSSKEWMLEVGEKEEIGLIAASETLVCFSTTSYLVKIASIYGTQRGILSMPGPLVSMAAYKNSVLIAYHRGPPRKNDQNIGIRLVEVTGFSLKSREIGCALGPEGLLLWLGFSDCGTPTLIDSLGMLCMYPKQCDTWIPFCDTSKHRKSTSDGFFVTAVFESYQTVAGIKCKGTVFPSLTPRPTLCELPLEPPFAESSTEKSQLEMSLFTWSNLKMEGTDRKIKETGLKSFALACRNNLDQRALEFMEILSNPQVLDLGIKYTMKLDKRRLAEKLREMAAELVQECDEESDDVRLDKDADFKLKKLSLGGGKLTPIRKMSRKEEQPPRISESSVVELTQSTEMFDDDDVVPSSIEEPKNPFLKNLKQVASTAPPNPLSLTNKAAGVDFDLVPKENKRKIASESDEKQKPKQRKLDKFMFSKRN